MPEQDFTRRGVLALAAGFAGIGRVYAFSSDFWNKKEPSEWTGEEIDQLTNKSPWAKDITVGGQSGFSGMSPIGMGGGMGGGRRRGGGMPSQQFKGLVRWESAKPIMEALKTQLPDGLSNHYVITVGGIPLNGGGGGSRRYPSQDDSSSSGSNQDALNRLKGLTYLEPKEKRDLQPSVVLQPEQGYGPIYFGFPKEMLTLKADDKEVTFTSTFGRLPVKAKFNLKDMLYRGELAV